MGNEMKPLGWAERNDTMKCDHPEVEASFHFGLRFNECLKCGAWQQLRQAVPAFPIWIGGPWHTPTVIELGNKLEKEPGHG